MKDPIERQAAIDIVTGYSEQLNGYIGTPNDTDVYAYARGLILGIERNLNALQSTKPEIVRCKDCENWIPGYITDNDDFIPPKCGKYQQMVGHSASDYCSLAEAKEDTDVNVKS